MVTGGVLLWLLGECCYGYWGSVVMVTGGVLL